MVSDRLSPHRTNDVIVPVRRGLHFLGLEIAPDRCRLRHRMTRRLASRLILGNAASYRDLVTRYGDSDLQRQLSWQIFGQLDRFTSQ